MNSSVCAQCDSDLGGDADLELGSNCLLLLGLSDSRVDGESSLVCSSCADSVTGNDLPAVGAYETLSFLHNGSVATIYKARHRVLTHIDVALKVLTPAFRNDPIVAERFLHECRVIANLNHPNIVTPHDIGISATTMYCAMEYVDGVNLRVLRQTRRPDRDEIRAIVSQIGGALGFARGAGFVARRIRPESVMLDYTGSVKLMASAWRN